MKLSVFFSFLFIAQAWATSTYSQETRLTLDMKNVRVMDVLDAIEKKSEFFFFFNEKLVNVDRKVDIEVKEGKIEEILSDLFQKTDINYKVIDRQIILTPQSVEMDAVQQVGKKVSGKVTDSTGGLLPGVSVVVKGTTTGVVTDNNGSYSLSNIPENATLQFSFVGMTTKEIASGNKTTINVTLDEETIGLDEVVAIGYGTVKKSDLTGSVSSVKSDKLVAFPNSGAVQALQGRAAGVQITANNGDPGGSMSIKVRGGTSINASNNPLYVVDGFPGAFLPQPEDIESLEILKDASATAIYGSRGANGVVMITTKKGKKGKVKIEYNASISQQKETKRIELLNAQEFLDFNKPYYPNYVSDGQETDWLDVILQKGSIQTQQLSVSGGNEVADYYISGSYFDQKGLISSSGFNKYSITSNINIKATDWFKIGLNLFLQRSNTDGVPTQEGSGGSSQAGIIGSALRFMPDQGIYKPDGVTYSLAKLGDPIDNPYTILKENTSNQVDDRIQANISGEFKITKDLTFNTILGLSTNSGRIGTYASSLTSSAAAKGNATMNAAKNSSFDSENFFNYNHKFASIHALTAMVGYSHSLERRESWGAASNAFITDAFSFWNMGGGAETPSIASSGVIEAQLTSFFGRLTYGLNDKYLLTLNSRYDGSSRFSKNHKWAFFPSGSMAWNMHKESFMKNIPLISQFKWRISYGVVGNQAIGSYQTLARLSPVLSIVNGVVVNAVRPTAVANDNLKWESTASTNVGADIAILKNRINFTVDMYKNVTSDMLFQVNLPPYAGIPSQMQNIGKYENKGLELSVASKNMTGQFKWTTDFNITFNRSKILELPDNGKDILSSNAPGHWPGFANSQILRVGQPLGSFYGYIYDGVYQTGDTFIPGAGFEQAAGGEKYRDINGKDASGKLTGLPDNTLNTNDQTIIGNPNPKFFYGFNNEFSYKGFDLGIFIQGSQGNDIYSYTLQELENLGAYGYNSTKKALERWSPTNTNTDVPMKNLSRSLKPSSRWVMDGSYLRVKNIMLGYTLPNSIVQKLSLQKARIYLSAQNFFTITKYRGFDPEVNYRMQNNSSGTDYASYPMAKSITAGLNIVF
ncbi:MAG: TonB-dependent receptor [Mariniphaga sp.]|nr:TonB-dependent receptor [Mariniphaga sp.]